MISSIKLDIRDISILDLSQVSFVNVSSYLAADRRSGQIQGPDDAESHFEHNQRRWTEDFNKMVQRGNPAEHFRAVFNGQSMIGFVWFGPHKETPEEAGEIYSLYVHPDFWGQGVGKALFQNATQTLCDSGFKSALVETDKNDPLPNGFYKKIGGSLLPESARPASSGLELVSYKFDF